MHLKRLRRAALSIDCNGIKPVTPPGARVYLCLGLLLIGAWPAIAQRAASNNSKPAPAESSRYSIAESGAHHRVWKRVTAQTNETGKVTFRTNSYTQLATGLNHKVGNQWVASSDKIEITPEGGAATNSLHQVYFSANINTIGGIHLITPGGQHLRSTVLGLSYYDTASGKSAFIAELHDSLGLLLQSGNQVIYTNALADSGSDFQADVRYTHRKGSFEQDVIVNGQPPTPSEFGLNPHTTRLQIWTEFYDAPEPKILTKSIKVPVRGEAIQNRRSLEDQTVKFDGMRIGKGNAFSIGGDTATRRATNGNVLVPVAKHWIHQGGRTFLVEEVLLDAVAPQLNRLPVATPKTSGGGRASPGQALFHAPPAASGRQAQLKGQSLRLAKSDMTVKPSLVLDYQTIDDEETDYTFQSDTTYYVSGPLNLYGTTTFEGGTVIKSAETDSGTTVVNGEAVWLTSAYRPAIFTSPDDDSVGVSIDGSSGLPTVVMTSVLYCPEGGLVHDARFSYAANAFSGCAEDVEVTDCQFIKCNCPITANSSTTTLGLHNVLIQMDDSVNNAENNHGNPDGALTIYSDTIAISGEHVTADLDSQNFITYEVGVETPGNSSISFTNSIIFTPQLSPVYSWGGDVGITPATNSVYYASTRPSGVFQTVGAGCYYLDTNSPCRAVGTASINPTVLADIAQKTTWPPLYLTNKISIDTTLYPQAQRDINGNPDLGYHYAPVDFLNFCIVSNAVLTLKNGVVLGYYGYGLWLQDGSQLVSQGSADHRNYLVYYHLVQEQTNDLLSEDPVISVYNSRPFMPARYASGVVPMISMSFTTVSTQNHIAALLTADGGGDQLSSLTLSNCEIYACGAYLHLTGGSDSIVVSLRNNLFHRCSDLEIGGIAQTVAYNNLFFAALSSPQPAVWVWFDTEPGSLIFKNNAMDNCDVALNGDYDYNGYLNGATPEMDTDTHAQTGSLVWQTGPLGFFYQPSDSLLIDVGSTTANAMGMHHYTTQTSQTKDTSDVDIGYHYVALNESGLPVDTDADGIPDYVEDANGNGTVDSGETNWDDASDLGLNVVITRPKANSIIP